MTLPFDPAHITFEPVTVTFLEMHNRPASVPTLDDSRLVLLPRPIDVETYRHYYYGVGANWFWLDRMVMEDELLYSKINAENIDIFVFYIQGEAAGYAEFIKEKDFTEVLYFGLLPAFIGKGFGHSFLQQVIQQAWSYQPKWIQLNTCTLDHPNALPNYKKAGFAEVKKATEQRRVIR
jgi:GNAT superfamily N-acetyltransferase